MRFSTVAVTATLCLSASSLSSIAASDSGVCGLTKTCVQNATSVRACSANETADFAVVSKSLQTCKDISYYFSQGQPWPINDKAVFCAVNAPCGALVPYLRNTAYLADLCESFVPFADTIATFRDYCRGEPVQQLTGDNGLLLGLELGNGTVKPTPAPTDNNAYRVETITPSATQTTGVASSSAASTSKLLAALTAVAAVVAMTA